MSSQNEYIEKTKTKLDEVDNELMRLQAKADAAKDDVKRKIEAEINDIRRSRKDLEHKLVELRTAGDAAWDDIKAGAELAWQSLSQSVESAAQRFK